MQITTFDIVGKQECSIEVPLRRLAASADAKEAAYWRKLLEFVDHLHSQNTKHVLYGYIILKELNLAILDPPDPVRDKAMKEFAEEWRRSNPDAKGRTFLNEMGKKFPSKPKTTVRVWIDWLDWVPLQDYVSQVHYRIQVRHPGKVLSEVARAKTPVEAEQVIRRAFGW